VLHSDLAWSVLISSIQHHHSVCGSVGEIGVHHGAYFAVLAATAVGYERLFACDVFEEGYRAGFNVDRSGRGSQPQLFATLRDALGSGFEPSRDLSLFPHSSLFLHDEQARKTSAWTIPPFRMLSIDGGHMEVLAFSDLRWAAARVSAGGVIALDDVMNPSWPGVSRAIRGFYHYYDRQHTRLRPLLLTTKKLFLTDPEYHTRYLHALCDLPVSSGRHLMKEYGAEEMPHPRNTSIWSKLTTVSIEFVGNILMLTEPPINATLVEPILRGNARGLAKRWERERPMRGFPKLSKGYSVAISKQMLSFLASTYAEKLKRGMHGAMQKLRMLLSDLVT
ncbi:MAG: hypothetical protein SGPRY_008673, partial [Prymnesium sp.]